MHTSTTLASGAELRMKAAELLIEAVPGKIAMC